MMPSHGTSLPVVLRARAAETPDRPFAVDVDDRQLTYGQMTEWMDRWAAAWRRAGVEPGDYVVTMQYNTFESLAGWLGLACIGAIETAINTDYRGDLLKHALNITRAKTMLMTQQYLDRVRGIAPELPHLKRVIVIDADGPVDDVPFEIVTGTEFLAGVEPIEVESDPAVWDIAAVLFTSGTTGPSKAVRMPWGQLYATAISTLPFQDLVSEDVFFNAGPTYHIGAKVFPFIAALVGGRHVMRPYVSESKLSFEYRKYGVTTCFYPPLMWLDEPPRPDDADCALRNLLFPIPLPQMPEFKRRFGCRTFSVYSMTEMSCPIADRDWDIGFINEQGLFSCGKLRSGFPGYEARIVDAWDQPVLPGEVGELIVRASEPWGMNAGYLNNPEATATAWRNGWFHTGDAFSTDAEGYFYFRDRMKDCIRRKAENISSFEVEAGVKKHPEIADCAAVAAKLSEEATADEEIRLVAVRKSGSTLTEEALIRWMIPQMPRFMIPRFVEFMDQLPRTPNLKVQKAVLRNRPIDVSVWDREAAGVALPH
jgi:crotonobetaine/carnitine-CoA ligase